MSVASPPRPRVATTRAAMIEDRPMRHPNASSREVMTKRGWWLVVLNFLVPGSAQVLAGSRRLGRIGLGATLLMWALAIVVVLFALLWPTAGLSIATGAWLPGWLSLLRPIPLLIAQGLVRLDVQARIVLQRLDGEVGQRVHKGHPQRVALGEP